MSDAGDYAAKLGLVELPMWVDLYDELDGGKQPDESLFVLATNVIVASPCVGRDGTCLTRLTLADTVHWIDVALPVAETLRRLAAGAAK